MSPLIKQSKIRFLYYFVCLVLVRIVYITLMKRFSRLIRFKTDYTTYLYYGVMWAFLILGVIDARVKLRPRLVLFIIGALIVMAGSCFCYEYSREYVLPATFWDKVLVFDCTSLLNSFLFIVIGCLITDYAYLMDCLHLSGRIAMFGVIIVDVLTIIVLKNKKYDDMSYAYCVCFITCILLFWYLEERHPLDGILSIFGMVSILLCGTRGPVICLLVMFTIWSFLYQKNSRFRIIAVVVFLVIILLFYTGLLSNVAKSISEWLEANDMPSFRILDMLQMDEISDDSGRGNIYDAIREGINERLILGYGIGGDRVLTDHAYAHNIFLEFICDFGIFFGLMFLAVICYYLIRGIFDHDRNLAALSVIFFAGAGVKLVFSSSYILLPELYLILGIILNRPILVEYPVAEHLGIYAPPAQETSDEKENKDETVAENKTDSMQIKVSKC